MFIRVAFCMRGFCKILPCKNIHRFQQFAGLHNLIMVNLCLRFPYRLQPLRSKSKDFDHLPLHKGGFGAKLIDSASGGRFVNRPYGFYRTFFDYRRICPPYKREQKGVA